MKKYINYIEIIFDLAYLLYGIIISIFFLYKGIENNIKYIVGFAALVLVVGDSFHLIPRIILQITKNEEKLRKALGRGKLFTSITMTIFYLLFFVLGEILLYGYLDSFWTNIIFTITVIRIVICLYPQNKWEDRFSPFKWVLYRNVPFVLEGAIVTVLFFKIPSMKLISVLIVSSFLCYLPVAFFADKNSKLGILMIPKTLAYVFMLGICLSL